MMTLAKRCLIIRHINVQQSSRKGNRAPKYQGQQTKEAGLCVLAASISRPDEVEAYWH